MNYIKRLEVANSAQCEQILDTREELSYLKSYLQSEKFHTDTTVQVQDVLNRLVKLEECLSDVYFDIKQEEYKTLV